MVCYWNVLFLQLTSDVCGSPTNVLDRDPLIQSNLPPFIFARSCKDEWNGNHLIPAFLHPVLVFSKKKLMNCCFLVFLALHPNPFWRLYQLNGSHTSISSVCLLLQPFLSPFLTKSIRFEGFFVYHSCNFKICLNESTLISKLISGQRNVTICVI